MHFKLRGSWKSIMYLLLLLYSSSPQLMDLKLIFGVEILLPSTDLPASSSSVEEPTGTLIAA